MTDSSSFLMRTLCRSHQSCQSLVLVWAVGLRPLPRGMRAGSTPCPDAGPGCGRRSRSTRVSCQDQTDAQGGQVMTRGPIHEAFAAPMVHDPKAAPIDSQSSRRHRSRRCRLTRSLPARMSSGSPATGAGTSRAAISSGSAASGASHRPIISGFPATGTRSTAATSGSPEPGFRSAHGQSQSQQSYLPPPPASLEAGPNTPQPSANVSWTPGFWSWQASGYVWRPGFWAAVQPNWIWMPAHYVWTPSGYLFVPGYWDLPVANRGLMFAPVYYPQPVYAQPNFVFTPSISIVGSAVTANLFVQASTNQYLFGNFYAQNFVSVGITPWFSFSFATGRPAYYDPLFSLLRRGQRAAEPGLGGPGPRTVRSSSRSSRAQAAEYLHRTDADHRAKRKHHPKCHGRRSPRRWRCR